MQKLNTYVFYLLIICTHTQTHERFSNILYMYEFREYRVYREYKIIVVMERSWFLIGNNKSYFFCELDSQEINQSKSKNNQIP